ncbi:MAG TPA: hypothetical protein VIM23_13415 [Gaiellaceae bacterium]
MRTPEELERDILLAALEAGDQDEEAPPELVERAERVLAAEARVELDGH